MSYYSLKFFSFWIYGAKGGHSEEDQEGKDWLSSVRPGTFWKLDSGWEEFDGGTQ